MPRPPRCRRICGKPQIDTFCPNGGGGGTPILLTLDEYEVIRLVDLEQRTHEQCAAQMDISRSTVQEIYESARQKIAACLVHGKPLRITGGNYRICGGEEHPHCGRSCRMRTFNESDHKQKGEPDMKRKIHILLIFLLLCAFLSGCGARNAAPASEEQAQSIAAEDNHANSAADRAQESPLENTPAQAVSEETAEPEETAELEETLLITITVFSNGTDDQDGIDLIVYTCDQDTLELQQLFRKKINATYPANTVDFEHGIFYFADADEERLYDNLYAYDRRHNAADRREICL